jgi:hypothetical protein
VPVRHHVPPDVADFSDAADEIKKLDQLKQSKSITDEEYRRLRARLVQ